MAGHLRGLLAALQIAGAAVLFSLSGPSLAPPVDAEPIAYIGHGAFFAAGGKQIVPTEEFIAKAQDWYRQRLLVGLKPDARAEFAKIERMVRSDKLLGDDKFDPQTRLVINQYSLDWLMANTPAGKADWQMVGKINALSHLLTHKLQLPDGTPRDKLWQEFVLDPAIASQLKLLPPPFGSDGGVVVKSLTIKSGQDYIDECRLAGVPIPPPIGRLATASVPGWTIRGEIPPSRQFISQQVLVGSTWVPRASAAQVRTFDDANGRCIALPRFTGTGTGPGTTVELDGVICLSRTTSKVCFWDNQMSQARFSFGIGTQIPIGAPDTTINSAGLYQAGGAELEGGSGGVCTDCHAGENPFIIHPDVALGGGVTMGDATIATYAPNRYDPIVASSWPQNSLSHALPYVPTECSGCHQKNRSGGRFPHLSSDLPGYCGTILATAVAGTTPRPPGAPPTMPQGSPGSAATVTSVNDFRSLVAPAACSSPPGAGPSDRGDPHLTTTNNINYDFQSAGEFTALRNSDTGFELQTRQTPVQVSFIPAANPYTGLQSCVSLNTAAAMRVGKHRISYQPLPGRKADVQAMQLLIDGRRVTLGSSVNLGSGNSITAISPGSGIDVRLADGTRVIISPEFWANQGYWYLNVEVVKTPAREGTMGHVPASSWLPLAPDGSSFGAMPASLGARYLTLNRRFADAWRVTPATSLFAYAPGTSTASFTDRAWPPKPGEACTVTSGIPSIPASGNKPVKGMDPREAKKLCSRIEDPHVRDICTFDATVTGDPGVVAAYQRTIARRAAAL
jgi:hypothetical protein